tara:strand:- start:6577 stop:7320 length:744 start_codon:yes stop_codon:yes gene_type:complete
MTKKRGRKRTNGLYFGPDQEAAVVEFLQEEDYIKRNAIYNKWLREPLNTMIESIIRRYKLYRKNYSFEDLHTDTLSNLILKADKFDVNSGNRAYSYYGTICKNYLLAHIMKDVKVLHQTIDFDTSLGKIHQRDEYVYELPETDYSLGNFITTISNEIKDELEGEGLGGKKKMSDNEKKVGHALIEILDNWETIFEDLAGGSKYNKQNFLETIRNYTGLHTKDIRLAMVRYKRIYKLVKGDKIDDGYL